jgi:hypothetical protein
MNKNLISKTLSSQFILFLPLARLFFPKPFLKQSLRNTWCSLQTKDLPLDLKWGVRAFPHQFKENAHT